MASAAAAISPVRVVVIGGISVNDPNSHDDSPWNFINPGVRRARALAKKSRVRIVFYGPSYERRVKNQRKEHRSVANLQKRPLYFQEVVANAAKGAGIEFVAIASAAELTAQLNALSNIASVDYFGHSNVDLIFLEYGSIKTSQATDTWGLVEALSVSPTHFTADATFSSYGCDQGEVNGLMDRLRQFWRVSTVGSRGATQYEECGAYGGPDFPKSSKAYVRYAPLPPGTTTPLPPPMELGFTPQ